MLIVEDEFISRTLLVEILKPYGVCHVATSGCEAVDVLDRAYAVNSHYDLVCLDIMIPDIDGQEVLKKLRHMEASRGIGGRQATRVIITTALNDSCNIIKAFLDGHCDAYLTKPIDSDKLLSHLRYMQLIGEPIHGYSF